MAYWGAIQVAASERGGMSGVWNAIREQAAAVPGGAPLPPFLGVNEAYAAAVRLRNAGEALGAALELEQRTGLPQSIGPGMMSYAPWSRPLDEIATFAKYQVRFNATFTALDGSQFSQWLTASFTAADMPATAGELADALATSPAIDTPPAGAEFISADSAQITVV